MPAVPDELQMRFEKWSANGRPPQASFEWLANQYVCGNRTAMGLFVLI